jgi:ubiquinone/menaquinone biosynthesis C-methylase UbiE
MSNKQRVCPWWLGYFLLLPLRRLFENPGKVLGPYAREGMTVVEPGSGMGYFTKELARLVGPSGRVIAVDVQPKMIAGLRRRLKRAGLLDRVETRLAESDSLGIDDLRGKVDLVVALYVVHEIPDKNALFRQLFVALKPGSHVLVAEPSHHVSEKLFAEEMAAAKAAGFQLKDQPKIGSKRTALLVKP